MLDYDLPPGFQELKVLTIRGEDAAVVLAHRERPEDLICIEGVMDEILASTVVWQFVFSGFGEEFVFRGYVQSRLNQAFGRPLRLFGIQFGVGLIVALF